MLNSASAMVFHFGCELHEQNSFSHMLANIEERSRRVLWGILDSKREGMRNKMLKIINYEADGVNVLRKERWRRYSMDRHNSRRREGKKGGREGGAAQFMPLSPCS